MSSRRRDFINPVRVFFSIVIVVIVWFAPIAFPIRDEKAVEPVEPAPLLALFASSADACPFKCVVCTAWDENAWPRHCAEYICDTSCEGDPGGGGTNQPPTISYNLPCTQPGNNSWCVGNLSLDLTASDPQGSQVIISGDVNGIAFTCLAGTTCSVPLPEGSGSANYRVDASSTGLFATGNATYLLDTSTPQLNGSASGVVGTNGWYKSDVTLSVTPSDTISGIASTTVTVDGGAQSIYSAPITVSDGIHTVTLSTIDNAGNITQTTQTFHIDMVTPVLNVSLSGSTGLSNWYISTVTVTPTASDTGSGIASLEVSIDGSAFTNYQAPITFSDGIHSYQFRATDNAGNITQTAVQQIKVDTTTPAVSLKINGTRGQNDWYVSDVTVTPTASDGGAGVGVLEALVGGGSWTVVNAPLSFSDGIHNYQIRVRDNAGNETLIPIQQVKVDTVYPVVAMDDELTLGETLSYDLEDSVIRSSQVSGLWINRQVIEDDAEKYEKVAWQEDISGQKFQGDILWDGKFSDGVSAEVGTYFITLKISDAAGNETMRTAIVKVNALSFLQIIPPFTLPQTTTLPAQTTQTDSVAVTEFGGTNSGATGTESTSTTSGGTAAFNSETDYIQSGFTQRSETTSTPITNTNILWGAAATALLGATLADWQRKREEEEARRRAEAAAQEEGGGGSGKKTPGQIAYEKMMQQKHIVGALMAEKKESIVIPNQKLEDEETNWLNTFNPVYQYEKRKVELQKKAELQAGLSEYYEGRKAGEEAENTVMPTKSATPTANPLSPASSTPTLFFQTPTQTLTPSNTPTSSITPLAPTASATSTASQTPTASKTTTPWAQTSTSMPATNTPPASPTAVPTPTAIANNIASQPQREKIWWLPSSVEKATRDLLGTLPDTSMVSHRQETPVFGFMTSNGMLSFGHVTEISMGTKSPSFQKGNVNVEMTPEGGRVVTSGNPTLSTEAKPNGVEFGVKVNSPVKVEEKGYSGNLGYSAQMSLDWAGNGVADSIWNSTLTFDLNHVDVDVSTGTEGVTQGSISDGDYVKFKPAQVAAVGVLVTSVVIVLNLYPPSATFPVIGEMLRETIEKLSGVQPSFR